MFTQKQKGFTLIELLVVIAIIGILSSVVLASLNSARQKSRDARRISDLKQLQLALEMSYDADESYPSTASSTAGLKTDGYIPSVPVDPKDGSSYSYGAASDGSGYDIRAKLERTNKVLDSDVDGTVHSVDCADTTEHYYCVSN